jgi:Ca2+/Na+ antiporter
MTVAKSVAAYGNWGIAAGEFESASSSLLYTLLLAGSFAVFSAHIHILIPFLINALAAVILLVVVRERLGKEGVKPFGQLVILLAIIFFTPLPILVIAGMEHTLQCLFFFLFVFPFSDWLAEANDPRKRNKRFPVKLLLISTLICAIRYEGVFLIAIACLLLMYRRRIWTSLLLGISGLLPIVLFGIYSIAKGSYFFPNSVLLKSDGARLSSGGLAKFIFVTVGQKLTISLVGISTVAAQYLLIILPLTFLLFAKPLKRAIRHSYVLIILFGCTFLQLILAATGWFYRYEAYLILCAVYILLVLLYQYRDDLAGPIQQYPMAMGFLLFALFLPICLRTAAAFHKASRACTNIYDQQYQMAKFLHTYYDSEVVAANDIGAISYYKKATNFDLWGLANIKVARSKKGNYCTPAFLDSLSRSENAGIAVVFDSWFSDSLLRRWSKVATWTIPDNVICGDSIVSFYAIDKRKTEKLRLDLRQYQPSLPAGIRVSYY